MNHTEPSHTEPSLTAELTKMRERVGELKKFRDTLDKQIRDGTKIIYDLESRIRDQRKGAKR